MKRLIFAALISLPLSSYSQAPEPTELEVFKTCVDELQSELTRVKKVMIKEFNLKIRQKDIFVYGPYQVGDQYFKADYVIFAPKPAKVTAEFSYGGGDEGNCTGVSFQDYVY